MLSFKGASADLVGVLGKPGVDSMSGLDRGLGAVDVVDGGDQRELAAEAGEEDEDMLVES